MDNIFQTTLVDYSLDCDNPEKNYNLALQYYNIGQTAAAISFFLRAAEIYQEKNYHPDQNAYKCLLYAAKCFDLQKNRDASTKSMLSQAITLCPERPEAYFYMAKFYESQQKYCECYTFSSLALSLLQEDVFVCDILEYKGKHDLLLLKAKSSWYMGKVKECMDTYSTLCNNDEYWNKLSLNDKNYIMDTAKKLNLEIIFEKSIPVMGVPIVNGVHWLRRLINSIDYPIDNFFIINNNGRGEITKELNDLVETPHNFIKKFHVTHLPSNLGVPGSFNLVFKSFLTSPYWILATNDIEFTPGFLEEMVKKSQDPEVGIVHCSLGGHDIGGFECFLIKDFALKKYGLFDENLYPAYCEDLDYFFRILNDPNPIKREFCTTPYLHGGTNDYSQTGSQTWRSDDSGQMKEKMYRSRWHNENKYFMKKWGPSWRQLNIFKTPFNGEEHSDFDLDFMRFKHTGF